MNTALEQCTALLHDLVAFPSVSGQSNLPIVEYIERWLAEHGVPCERVSDESGERANLFATIGPDRGGGIMLSAHLDVVPALPDGWDSAPFTLTERDGLLFGRGAVDMKGFLAAVLAMVPVFQTRAAELDRPLHLAFTYDEESGNFGAQRLYDFLMARPTRPAIAIVGEPTGMRPIVGHKAGYEMIAEVHGAASHAARPYAGVNAIHYASRLIGHMEERTQSMAVQPRAGSPFDPPYTTINVGWIEGGMARNVVPESCRFDWEIRPIPEDDGDAILAGIQQHIDTVLQPEMRARHPDTGITLRHEVIYPALRAEPDGAAARLVRDLWTDAPPGVFSIGTDGGYFQAAGISTVILGPGQTARMHETNEYIEVSELEACLDFLARLPGYQTASWP
jgi:acetylornithine deacetylase